MPVVHVLEDRKPLYNLKNSADCRIYFLLEEWHFTFTETADCAVIVWYADFCKYNIIVVIIVVVDLFALTRVHSFNKAVCVFILKVGKSNSDEPAAPRQPSPEYGTEFLETGLFPRRCLRHGADHVLYSSPIFHRPMGNFPTDDSFLGRCSFSRWVRLK